MRNTAITHKPLDKRCAHLSSKYWRVWKKKHFLVIHTQISRGLSSRHTRWGPWALDCRHEGFVLWLFTRTSLSCAAEGLPFPQETPAQRADAVALVLFCSDLVCVMTADPGEGQGGRDEASAWWKCTHSEIHGHAELPHSWVFNYWCQWI